MSKEITTVLCQGPDNCLSAPVSATVEPGVSPRRVSCPFVIRVEVFRKEGGGTKRKITTCKPMLEVLKKEQEPPYPDEAIDATRCTHAYPV